MIDRICSFAVLGWAVLVAAAYGVRAMRRGHARYDRVDDARGSALLGARPMHAGYWSLQPIARLLVRAGVSADAVTWTSLGLAACAAAAIAQGHYGLGALLACVAAVGDALDGLVARMSDTASDAGEVLDSAVDRYSEAMLLGAIAFAERDRPLVLAAALAAIVGSFMVSYATAKAEAMRAHAPRGVMRRAERAVYLVAGAALTPLLGPMAVEAGESAAFEHVPIVAAVCLVAVVGNVSAIARLAAVARALRRRVVADPAVRTRRHQTNGVTAAKGSA